MPNKNREYYYMDLDLKAMKVVGVGKDRTATHTGDTGDLNVHRIFLPKGQYSKLVKKLDLL